MRVNHDYHRRGAVAYLAALDVHRAKVFGRWEDTTGITSFETLVEPVMTQAPYWSARRVFWVVDNGPSHRGPEGDRLVDASVPQRGHGATLECTHRGSIRWRFVSPSSNVRCSRPTTSPTPTRSPNVWPASKNATTRAPQRSNGSSPPVTYATSCTTWTATPNIQPHKHRRTYEFDHLAPGQVGLRAAAALGGPHCRRRARSRPRLVR